MLAPIRLIHHHSIFRSRHCSVSPKFTTKLNTNLISMPPPPLYSDLMDVIQNTSTIRVASSNYKVHSRIIKNLIVEFEANQYIRIRKENKTPVEKINQIQITRWAKDRLSVNHGNWVYTYWDLMTTGGLRVLLNESYEDMKSEYGITMSTMTSHLKNIFHLLQCRNTRHLQKRVKT